MNLGPVLPLAGLTALGLLGLLGTRLRRLPWRHIKSLELVLAAGVPLVLLGLVLGPGIGLISRPVLQALAPVTALGVGWVGAALGARFEWRCVRRIPRGVWLLALISAAAVFLAAALGAWGLGALIPALAAAWTPRLPAVLALAAVAAVSAPGVVTGALRAVGIRRSIARALGLAASLETALGTLAITVPLALHRSPAPAGRPELGWLYWMVFAIGSGALVGLVFLSLTRLQPEPEDVGFALLGTMLFGAGSGYAADLSPFVVCALASVVIINRSPRRRQVRALLAEWEHPISNAFLIMAGALLTVPSAWILVAVPLLVALRVAGRWVGVRSARLVLKRDELPPHAGFGAVAQDGAAIALGINYFTLYDGLPANLGGGGAVLTTIALGVVVARLAAPPLTKLVRRPAAAPLTPVPTPPELTSIRSGGLTS